MTNDYMVGDMVFIKGDIDHDDPVANEYINKHATIKSYYPPWVEVEFLNGDVHRVMEKNVRKA